MADYGPSITACKLWEKVSAKGNRYMVGRLGGLRVTILQARENEEGGPSHVMLMSQADITTRPGSHGLSPQSERAPVASTAEQQSLPIRRYPASARARSPGRPRTSAAQLPGSPMTRSPFDAVTLPVCTSCGEEKPRTAFNPAPGNRPSSRCAGCERDLVRAHYRALRARPIPHRWPLAEAAPERKETVNG